MSERTFPLGNILTVTTGRVLCADVGELYELLNYMTGDNLFTHQLPRAADECAPALLAQHPQLADAQPPAEFDNAEHAWRWLAEQVDRFGAELPVRPLAAGDHTRIDPLTELRMMRPDLPIVVVVPEDGAS